MKKSNKIGLSYLIRLNYQRPVHDDAGNDKGGEPPSGGEPKPGDPTAGTSGGSSPVDPNKGVQSTATIDPSPGDKGKTFTQEDVNRILSEDKKKLREQNDKLIKDLESLKNSSSMTESEKTKLETKIEELHTQSMTEKEKAQREKEKLEKDLSKQIELLTNERDVWSKRCDKYMKQNELNIAANENDAFNAQQIVQILEPNTKLVENPDDGKLEVKVRFDDVDKEGKPVTLELIPKDAVKRMKDLPDRFGNLFKSGAINGLGSSNTNSNNKATVNLKDPAEYRKNRKSIKAGTITVK